MARCGANRVDFLFGLSRNARLVAEITGELAAAKAQSRMTGRPARRFRIAMPPPKNTASSGGDAFARPENRKTGGITNFDRQSEFNPEHRARLIPLCEIGTLGASGKPGRLQGTGDIPTYGRVMSQICKCRVIFVKDFCWRFFHFQNQFLSR
uniref:hypothetical protein n=1 Tax=Gluconacetobacter dulcium TaxID=2729096 RepID=UPI001600127C|nr:hypothetical protein [Gluconacetobacter dulcium]